METKREHNSLSSVLNQSPPIDLEIKILTMPNSWQEQ